MNVLKSEPGEYAERRPDGNIILITSVLYYFSGLGVAVFVSIQVPVIMKNNPISQTLLR